MHRCPATTGRRGLHADADPSPPCRSRVHHDVICVSFGSDDSVWGEIVKALVTGAAGFVGSHLVERLLDSEWTVVGVDSFAPTYETVRRRSVVEQLARDHSFDFIQGDINGIDLRPLIEETDVVFHLAARPGVRASWTDFEVVSAVNVLGTQRVLDAIAAHPTTRLVFASSSSVYGPAPQYPTPEEAPLSPISPYGVTKAACEALIGAYVSQVGLTAVSLRYFTVYGPRQRSDMAFTRWIRMAMRKEPLPIFGDGSAVRDFTYVADAVEATLIAATCDAVGHEIFNVAGGSPASVSQVIDLLEELLGMPIHVDHQPRALGDPVRTGGDATRLIRHTGWQPEWDLSRGLSRQIDWLRSAS